MKNQNSKRLDCDSMTTFNHIWFWKTRLPERKGHACRKLARGRMNSILVQFEDGYKVVTSRFAVRLANPRKENNETP